MEPVGSLPCSQEPSTGPYPEPDQSNLYHPILSKIHFNTVHPPTSWSSQWPPSIWLSHKYPICIPPLPNSCYMSCPYYADFSNLLSLHFSSVQIFSSAPFSNTLRLCSETKFHTPTEPQAKLLIIIIIIIIIIHRSKSTRKT
jgi:hypothetical protein